MVPVGSVTELPPEIDNVLPDTDKVWLSLPPPLGSVTEFPFEMLNVLPLMESDCNSFDVLLSLSPVLLITLPLMPRLFG